MITKIRTLPLRAAVKVQSEVVHAGSKTDSATVSSLQTSRGRKEFTVGAFLGFMTLSASRAFAQGDMSTTEQNSQGVVDLINTFTNFLIIVLAAGSLLMGIFAALQFVGSGGSEKVANRAKATIKNVVIGLVVAAGIFLLKEAVMGIVGGVDSSGDGETIREKVKQDSLQ